MPKDFNSPSIVTWRALLIGLLLIPVNCYWIIQMEVVRYSGIPTTISLLFNAVFCLFVLSSLNLLVGKLKPRFAFSQAEFLAVYVMICLASAIAGHGFMQMLVPIMAYPFWFATPENEWREIFWRYIPRWLTIDDMKALEGYYKGESTLYTQTHLGEWGIPILAWTAFIFALVSVMLCINIILRKQWAETEKLAYPAIQLPLEMMTQSRSFLKNRMMWVGFAIAGGLDLINGLHYIFPQVPYIPIKRHNLQHLFTEAPWNAIYLFRVSFYPFAIGISYFMPLDVSFSCWFFYLFFKGQQAMASGLGLGDVYSPTMDMATDEQSWGGYPGVLVVVLWMGRKHIWRVFKGVFGGNTVDDSKEPLRYRTTMIWGLVSFTFLLFFCYQTGMGVWVSLLFFLIYFGLSMAISRIRAEIGSPVHDMHWMSSDEILFRSIGTRALGPQNLTIFSLFYFFNRAQYSHVMPQQLEGFKLAERVNVSNRLFVWGLITACVVAPLATFWAYLHIFYERGAVLWHWQGAEAYGRLQRWLTHPTSIDLTGLTFMGVGFVSAIFLYLMRIRFIWWPFHPVGYAVSGSEYMNNIWFCILIGWVIKGTILRHGGVKAHQKAIPLFLGLILGEFTIGSLWTIVGILLDMPTYGFWF